MAAPAQPLQSVTVMPEQALALNPSTIGGADFDQALLNPVAANTAS